MHSILFQLVYCCWCVLLAFINKKWIENNLTVRHWANAVAHGMAMFQAARSFDIQIAIAIPFMVRIIFDGSLSLFRGLPFDYVSPAPKSFCDRIEKRIFGKNAISPRLLYLAIVVILNLIPLKTLFS